MTHLNDNPSIDFPQKLKSVLAPERQLYFTPTGFAWQAIRRSSGQACTVHLLPDESFIASRLTRLRREIARRRQHLLLGHLLPIDVGLVDDGIYFVTPLVRGKSFAEAITSRRCDVESIKNVLASAAILVEKLARAGFPHGALNERCLFYRGNTVKVVDLCYQHLSDHHQDDFVSLGRLGQRWLGQAGSSTNRHETADVLFEELVAGRLRSGTVVASTLRDNATMRRKRRGRRVRRLAWNNFVAQLE